MASPVPSSVSDTSSLTPPPSHFSSPGPSPPPDAASPSSSLSSLSSIARSPPARLHAPSAKRAKKTKAPAKLPKITLKLSTQGPSARAAPKKPKRPPKPREPKIEPIPRSLENNYDVPLVTLFRSKFRVLFSGTTEIGPQDVEEGVSVEGDVEG